MSHPSPQQSPQRKRCRRDNEPGHAHALTFSCFKRQAFLSRQRACAWFLAALDAARCEHALDLWAFVIMPEHVHVLICPRRARYSISEMLTSIELPVTRRAVHYVRRHAPAFLERMTDTQPNGKRHLRFWQRGGGYDTNLWSPRRIRDKIAYIHDNPVRRGLCERPEDWPWSSARAYQDRAAGPLRLDLDSLPPAPRAEGRY